MEKAFGLSHILFLVFAIAAMAAGIILIKKYCKSEKSIRLATYIVAGLMLASLIWNRVSLAVLGWGTEPSPDPDWRNVLPAAYCPFVGLVIPFCLLLFRKNWSHPIFHCLLYVAFIGGLVTLVMPATMIGNGDTTIFATRTLSNLFYHGFAVFLPLLMLFTKTFKPNWRYWWAYLLGLCVQVTFGLFLMDTTGLYDAMFLTKPFVKDTPLSWWLVGILSTVIFFIVSLSYEYGPVLVRKFRKFPDKQASEV